MEVYTTRNGMRIAVGDEFRDRVRADARTLRVEAITEPYEDWRGTRRCQVTYRVIAQVGVDTPPKGLKHIDAERLADRKLFERVTGGDPDAA